MNSPRSLEPFLNSVTRGDALRVLRQFPSESIDCVVTSPPYWSLRDYGVKGQLGLEFSVEEYVDKLCAVFDEVKRVLKREGTCWVNMGDAYSTRSGKTAKLHKHPQPIRTAASNAALNFNRPYTSLPPKCLVQLPARFALAMTSRGWILRSEIIWHKPNCMPSSAKDRFTVDYEKLFFFVKDRRYYFDRQFEPLSDRARMLRPLINPTGRRKRIYGDSYVSAINPQTAEASRKRMLARGRNKRCVWRITNRPFRGEHYAVFPEALIETPIRAGCPAGGVVLDPFMGSGTTAVVARRLNRRFIGIELNRKYVRMAKARLAEAT